MNPVAHPDFVIAGAGLIGLAIALELEARGAQVVVLEAGRAMAQSSTAAAGMLAVEDPANPPALKPLAQLSASVYAGFLNQLEERSGQRVNFQTASTLQELDASKPLADGLAPLADASSVVRELAKSGPRFALLNEHSIDPHQLASAVLASVHASNIELREETSLTRVKASTHSVEISTQTGLESCAYLIDCMGAWSPAGVTPRKGQILMVEQPSGLTLESVIRTASIYLVPRTQGRDAGRIVIGATVEDAGFDLEVHPRDILALNARAMDLLPPLASAQFVKAWAGLRPATPDGLPLLGATPAQPRYLVAGGHFRNGILLAPATAKVIAGLLYGEPALLDLEPFRPDRFRI